MAWAKAAIALYRGVCLIGVCAELRPHQACTPCRLLSAQNGPGPRAARASPRAPGPHARPSGDEPRTSQRHERRSDPRERALGALRACSARARDRAHPGAQGRQARERPWPVGGDRRCRRRRRTLRCSSTSPEPEGDRAVDEVRRLSRLAPAASSVRAGPARGRGRPPRRDCARPTWRRCGAGAS